MGKTQDTSALALIQEIGETGTLVARGYSSLQTVRQAIALVIQQSGYEITFDPGSHPDLVDYLTVAGTTALESAASGAFLGALVGALFGRPKLGAALGAGAGAGVGVWQGIHRVEQGWRIHAVRAPDQSPVITINAMRVG